MSHTLFHPCKAVVGGLYWNMKQFKLICNLGLYNAICRIRKKSQFFFLRRRIKTLVSRVCRNNIVNEIKKYISKVSLCSVKCRVACNRHSPDPEVACPCCRWPLSPALSVWHHNYTSVFLRVSTIKVLLSCSRMSTASCDTLCLSVSDLPPQAFQASRQRPQSLMAHYGVTTIDKKSILSKQ